MLLKQNLQAKFSLSQNHTSKGQTHTCNKEKLKLLSKVHYWVWIGTHIRQKSCIIKWRFIKKTYALQMLIWRIIEKKMCISKTNKLPWIIIKSIISLHQSRDGKKKHLPGKQNLSTWNMLNKFHGQSFQYKPLFKVS